MTPRALAPLRATLATLCFVAATLAPALHAHDEWNNLHITNASRSEYVYPFDGRSPKIGASLLNHHETAAPAVAVTLLLDGQPAPAAFRLFPEGTPIVVDPHNFGFATTPTAPIFDGLAGAVPAVGASRDVRFDFVFRLAPGAIPPPGQPHAPAATYTQAVPVRFTHLGENPPLAGPMPLAVTVRLPADASAAARQSLRAEISTPYSPWFPLALTPGPNNTATLSTSVLARADWHLRLTAEGHTSRVLALGHPNELRTAFDITLAPAPDIHRGYRDAAKISTPTAFHHAAVSELERTFVAFPGQQTFPSLEPTPARARELRSSGRIQKYRFDGTRLWEHAPAWETWAGDMTPDGRFVAYALNPTAFPFHTPDAHRLVLLDGNTGTPLWTKSAAPDSATGRQIASLALALSPDARVIAVGSIHGFITLFDRASGDVLWTTPASSAGSAASFGAVRRLRFSADSAFLYCGSSDSSIRKLRVTDGAVLWKTYAGGWPDVNGLDLTSDGAWLVAGTQGLDATVIRTSDGFMHWQRETQFPDATFSPDGRHLVTSGGQIYRTTDGSLAGMTKLPGLYRFTPDSRHLVLFTDRVHHFDPAGHALDPVDALLPTSFTPRSTYLTADGRYGIALSQAFSTPNQTGVQLFERSAATSAAPAIAAQPLSQTATAEASVTFLVEASSSSPLGFQWRKNGTLLPGANTAGLTLTRATLTDAATYDCVVTNPAGSVTTAPATLSIAPPVPADPPRLANLAVRSEIAGEPLIVGFALGGAGTSGTKPLLLRAAGPALASLGVNNPLADPRLDLFSGPTAVLGNDNWDNAPALATLATQVAAFPFPAGSRDAALAATAVAGSYTAQLSRVSATSGAALAEIYDASTSFSAATPRLVNLSARALAGPNTLLTAGFVVAGSAAKQILVRAIGPSLASFRVPNPLANPRLTLLRHEGATTTLVATNDDWHDAPNAVALADAAQRVTFPLAPDTADAALLLSLPPGNYTAQASGPTSGNVLIEIYDVP